MEVQGYIMHLDCHAMHMTRVDVVLGREWLHGLSPQHKYQYNILTFDAHGAQVLFMGEQGVLASSMSHNLEFHSIINKVKINSLVLCYLMPL